MSRTLIAAASSQAPMISIVPQDRTAKQKRRAGVLTRPFFASQTLQVVGIAVVGVFQPFINAVIGIVRLAEGLGH